MKFEDVKPDIAYRHTKCGQVTMSSEAIEKGDQCFCSYCGRYHPVADFIRHAAKE